MKNYLKTLVFTFIAINSAVVSIYLIISLMPEQRAPKHKLETAPLSKPVSPSSISANPKLKPPRTWSNDTKFILFWLPMWDSRTFFFGSSGYELFQHCESKNCFATHDRWLVPVGEFDVIVFHAAQYDPKIHGKPWERKTHQRYVFATMEPPTRAYPADLHRFRSFYNWTMTYRYDSDLVRPYGYVVEKQTNYAMPPMDSINRKTRLVAWFVSNCHTINRREHLHKKLRQYLDIDVYGACGKLQCVKRHHESSPECYDLIEKHYKFYLSFENSHCKDYVTEKLYRVLERNIVPVVYGYGDYKKITPPNSVIIADDFKNIKDLAKYLLYLNNNTEDYLKYFEWKKSYYIKIDAYKTACKLCGMLNNRTELRSVYEDIYLWWLGNNYSYCKIGKKLPPIINS